MGDGLSKIMRVLIFLPVDWMIRMCFTWAKDVGAPGAGPVARSSVGIIMTPPQATSWQEPRIRMINVVGPRKGSRPKTTVQEDTVAIVICGGEENTLSHKYSSSPETLSPSAPHHE